MFPEREFKVNDYITLKLEDKETVIYIYKKRFNQCKHLLIQIPNYYNSECSNIESIDHAAEILGWDGEHQIGVRIHDEIAPVIEFWAHCSNIQAWVENNYDTRILHSNLLFPLLKRLTELGEPKARVIFQEEIAKRIESYLFFNKDQYKYSENLVTLAI